MNYQRNQASRNRFTGDDKIKFQPSRSKFIGGNYDQGYGQFDNYDEYVLAEGLGDGGDKILKSHQEWLKDIETNGVPLSRLSSTFDPEEALQGYGIKHVQTITPPSHGIIDQEMSIYQPGIKSTNYTNGQIAVANALDNPTNIQSGFNSSKFVPARFARKAPFTSQSRFNNRSNFRR